MSLAPLSYVGPYRLLNLVASGHACQIWQAADDATQRIVCIKAMQDKFCKDREQTGYLRQEYIVGQTVRHQRIIEVYRFDVDRGRAYLSMEWFPAPNLKNVIRQGAEKIAHLMPKIIEQSAEALAHFHQKGWVHRDIKPENFLVSQQGEVKMIDFALAVKARRGIARWFATKAKIQGTRSYMAPEQIRGEAVDQRADIYSYGCTVYHLVAGRPPFTATSSNELLRKHLKALPPSLESVNDNVTQEFAQLVLWTLGKTPRERPQSLDEFLREFRAMRMFRVTPRPPAEPASGLPRNPE